MDSHDGAVMLSIHRWFHGTVSFNTKKEKKIEASPTLVPMLALVSSHKNQRVYVIGNANPGTSSIELKTHDGGIQICYEDEVSPSYAGQGKDPVYGSNFWVKLVLK